MFVHEEALLDVEFAAAQASLASLARGTSLRAASEYAYGRGGAAGMDRVGPLGEVRGMSRLVEVRYHDLIAHPDSAHLMLRWEAVGPGGTLFPALDADITLTPSGDLATLLVLDGVYRPPLGSLGAELDRALMGRVATATIRTFLRRLAEALSHPPGENGPSSEPGHEPRGLRPPAETG